MNSVRKWTPTLLLAVLALLVSGSASPAAEAGKKELVGRMKARYAKVLALKMAGKVGETTQGLLAPVTAAFGKEPQVAAVLSAENADRQALYRLLAVEVGTSSDLVARRNALRKFNKALPGEYLRDANGAWRKKK